MPHFILYDLIKWLHVLAMALGMGAAMVALVLVGFEDSREDLKGLTGQLWKRTTSWALRIAVVLGLILLGLKFQAGQHPFDNAYLHWKLTLVFFLLMFSEMSPKALLAAKRGAPMLAFVLFLLVSFVSVNKAAFGTKVRKSEPSIPVAGALEAGR